MEKQKTNSVMDSKQLLDVLLAFKSGDFSVRMPKDLTGIDGKIADALNETIEINLKIAKAVDKVSKNVGRIGKKPLSAKHILKPLLMTAIPKSKFKKRNFSSNDATVLMEP